MATLAFTDKTLPTVSSFISSDPSPTNASTVHYTLTFSEPVTGVDTSQFSLVTTGLGGASITSVTPVAGSNGEQYTITVNDGSGDGTLRVDFTGTNVRDLAGNGLAGGSFSSATAYAAGSGPEFGPAVADLNGDGAADLVVPDNYGRGYSVLLGNGDGTFQPALFTYLGYTGFHTVTIGDVNGDGKPDLAVENSDNGGTVSVLLGNGDGTFQPAATIYPTGVGTNVAALADLNGDGKLDIVAPNQSAGTISVLLGNGDGTFQQAVNYAGLQPNLIGIADLNGDGSPDIVVSNAGSPLVSVLINNGNGTFAAAVNYNAGSAGNGIAVGDLTGDGKPDIIAPTSDGLAVLLNKGDGTFGLPIDFNSGAELAPDAVADVNGDGKPDLIATDGATKVWILTGNGDGTFGNAAGYLSGDLPISAAVADLNGDGRPDIVVDNLNSNSAAVFLNVVPPISSNAVMVDKTAPTVTEGLVNDTGSSSTDRITSNPALTGSGDPNAIAHFTVDGTAIAATATANASGAWSFTPTGLADAQHTVVASETDAAGNTGTASLTFTLDTTAPSATILSEGYNSNKVTLTGSASDPNDAMAVYDNGTLIGTTASANNGAWTFTTGKLTDVVHAFTVTATDIAGNLGHGSNEAVLGSSKADVISGTSGNDILKGNGGNDVVTGGGGADLITGGSGKVTFSYNAVSDSTPAVHDTITDFSAKPDLIDFTNIAGINTTNGAAQFQGNITGTGNLTLNAHSVAYLEVSGTTEVLVNTTNTTETVTTADTHTANMEIDLVGVGLKLTASDFHHI